MFPAQPVPPTMSRFADAMTDADYVVINGMVFRTSYLRIPDDAIVADDVVLEATRGDDEVAYTFEEIDGAEALGNGAYRLKSGAVLSFLSTATVH
jgi:hypothetical protein